MSIQTSSYLKSKFEKGDRPTQADFHDLIDSTYNVEDTSKVHYLDPKTTGIGLTGYVFDETIYTSLTEPVPIENTVYRFTEIEDPDVDVTFWGTYTVSSGYYVKWDSDPRQLPYLVGSNGESRVICSTVNEETDMMAFVVLPGDDTSFIINGATEDALTNAMVNEFKVEIDSSFNRVHLTTADWTSCSRANTTIFNNKYQNIDLNILGSSLLLDKEGFIMEQKRHFELELYRTDSGRTAWTTVGGTAIIFKDGDDDFDGWGNSCGVGVNGRRHRYTLDKDNYNILLGNSIDVETTTPTFPLITSGVHVGKCGLQRGYRTYRLNDTGETDFALDNGSFQDNDEIHIWNRSTAADVNLYHLETPIWGPFGYRDNMNGLPISISPGNSIILKYNSYSELHVVSNTINVVFLYV